MLHETRAEAEESLDQVNATRCGGACVGRHYVIDLRTIGGAA